MQKAKVEREKFVPRIGEYYKNHGGGEYLCMAVGTYDTAVMQNTASGWTLTAHGLGKYEDGTIDWDYSTGGAFM